MNKIFLYHLQRGSILENQISRLYYLYIYFIKHVVNNVRMFCKNTDGAGNSTITGDGNTEGLYYGAEYCPAGSYVCGLNAQNEAHLGDSGDDTSINHVRFHCCSVTVIGW